MTEFKTQQPRGEPEAGVVGQAKGAASQMAGQAKDIVRKRVSSQTSRSATELGNLANALRQTGEQLEDNFASPLVSKAADRLERVSELLENADPGELLGNVESFARREPLLFLGGAFALGIVGARFLKSSASHAQSTGASESNQSASMSSSDLGIGGGRDFRP